MGTSGTTGGGCLGRSRDVHINGPIFNGFAKFTIFPEDQTFIGRAGGEYQRGFSNAKASCSYHHHGYADSCALARGPVDAQEPSVRAMARTSIPKNGKGPGRLVLHSEGEWHPYFVAPS